MRRLRIIMQNKTDDCGVTCVRMVLRYFGYYISQSEIENNEIFRDTDGISSMLDIKKCAEYYGLISKPCKIVDCNVFQKFKGPMILYWDYNHFVVFEKKIKDTFYVLNPARGRECLTKEEFSSHFSGIAMGYERSEVFKKRQISVKKEIRTIIESGIWNVRMPLKYICGLIVSQMLIFSVPILIKEIVSDYSYNISGGLGIGIAIIILIIVYALVSILTSKERIKYINNLKKHSTCQILGKVMRIPHEKIRKLQSGDIISRINNNNEICEIIGTEIPQAVVAIMFAGFATFYLCKLNFVFTLFFLLLCVLISLSNFVLMNRIIESMHIEIANYAKQNSVLTEGVSSIYFIKANNIASKYLDRWKRYYDTYIEAFTKKGQIVSYLEALQNIMSIVSQLLFLMLSFVLTIIYPTKVEEIAAFITMAMLIYTPITKLVYVFVEIIEEIPNVGRIINLVEEAEYIRKKYPFSLNEGIYIDNLSFRYPKAVSETLEKVSVTIKKGETVAILGQSGAGKTTFINLLMGLEKADGGEILYDRHNVEEIRMGDNICCITQDNILYNGKLAEYLSLFVDNYDDDRVMEGIEKLQLKNLFEMYWSDALFDIDENGANLSGGQKQRLALLRMFLKDYELLIFDEPTSHLDEQTAKVIIDEISKMKATKIIITHDTRLLDKADSIYEIKNHTLVKER